jgi:hypothetical protein
MIHEQWKGRIDQWQPRRRQQRRKRNTRSRIQKGKRGTPKASPKFLGGNRSKLCVEDLLLCFGEGMRGQSLVG